jgi:hypothetical protein
VIHITILIPISRKSPITTSEWCFVEQQETDMNGQTSDVDRQESKINELELTAEELFGISGGIRNNETEAWAVFQVGIIRGFEAAQPGSCGILF